MAYRPHNLTEPRRDGSPPTGGGQPRGRTVVSFPVLGVLVAVLLALLASGVHGGEVAILLSSEADPYVQAKAAAQAVLGDRQQRVRVVHLKDAAEKGMAAIGEKIDAVIAIGTPAALWAQKKLPADTPLVYCMVANPGGVGLSGRQTTYGVTIDVPLASQFKLIEQAVPKTQILGLLYRSDNPESCRQMQAATDSLPKQWRLEAVAIDKHGSVAAAIEELMRRHIHVIWTSPDTSVYDTAAVRALLLAALRTKTPVFGFSPAFVRAGGLIGVGVDPRSQGGQAAELTLRVGRGASDSNGPAAAIQPLRQFQIAVNVLVAEQLGIELPADLVQKATHVFKAEK